VIISTKYDNFNIQHGFFFSESDHFVIAHGYFFSDVAKEYPIDGKYHVENKSAARYPHKSSSNFIVHAFCFAVIVYGLNT
jgi:hypothetical protein